MHERLPPEIPFFAVRDDRPLIGIVATEDGRDVTRYFEDEAAAATALTPAAVEEALSAIGSWSDLDWDDMERALDRIRHDSSPTPLIDP